MRFERVINMPREISLCELCGRKPSIYNCEVEGTIMKVCEDCSKYGGVKGKSNVRIVVQESKKLVSNDPEYVFVQNYGIIVKNAREKLGLKQEDFAKNINEHKSLIHQVESEHIKPNILLARKLERALHVKIVNEVKPEKYDSEDNSKVLNSTGRLASKPKSEGLTFGDLINTKRK
jgi:putative transcription factor